MSILHARRRSCAASSLLLRGLGFTLVLFAFLALAADGVAHASEPATSATASLGLTTGEAIRAILGLLAVAALAYIAGRPFVRRFERSLGLSPLVAFGVPFLLLGLASHELGILSEPVLRGISPLLVLGLGWTGFALGFRFDLRLFQDFPRELLEAFVLVTLLPFAAIVGAAALLLALTDGVSADAIFFRDALVLATAGAMTTRTVVSVLDRARDDARTRLLRMIHLEELAAIAGILVLGAFFRNGGDAQGWTLPSFGWVFVTLGVGTALGVLTFASLTTTKSQGETLAVTLGAICLSAGVAGFLRLSPLVVCFFAGSLLANLPGRWKADVRQALLDLERPIYLLFLVLTGALWSASAWEAWVLMGFFVAARFGARYIGVHALALRQPDLLSPDEERQLASSPMGPLSIAIVNGAQQLFTGTTVAWIVHAVVMGAIVSDLLARLIRPDPGPRARATLFGFGRVTRRLVALTSVVRPAASPPPTVTPTDAASKEDPP
jgi:hypothetical protein